MVKIKSAVKLAVFCGLLLLPFAGDSYAEDVLSTSEQNFSESGMANNFEEALAQNERLRERYEGASFEEQQQMQERWQELKEKWGSMSDKEKSAMKERMQERKAKWESMSDEEKTAIKEKMQERKAKWESMTDEQKAAMKEKMKEFKASGRGSFRGRSDE